MTVRLSGLPRGVVASGAKRVSGASRKRSRGDRAQRAHSVTSEATRSPGVSASARGAGARNERSERSQKFDRALLLRRARRLLRELDRPDAELSLALVDDAAIAELNERDRGRRGPTDVLSYSLLEGPHVERRGRMLGDVVISVDTAARQARRGRRALDDELLRLLIHGVLHLLGNDHAEREEARAMRSEERRLWRAIGV